MKNHIRKDIKDDVTPEMRAAIKKVAPYRLLERGMKSRRMTGKAEIFLLINRHPEGRMTVSQIAADLDKTLPYISQTLKSMREDGVVEMTSIKTAHYHHLSERSKAWWTSFKR